MKLDNSSLIAFLGGMAAVSTSVWLFFEKADDVLSNKKKYTFILWIKNLRQNKSVTRPWPSVFVELINSIFGRNHFSIRCYAVSLLFSLLWVCIFSILFYSLNIDLLHKLNTSISGFWWALYSQIFFAVVCNSIIDFISLWETRKIVNYLDRGGTLKLFLLLLLDAILTYAIFIILFSMFRAMIWGFVWSESKCFHLFIQNPISSSGVLIDEKISLFGSFNDYIANVFRSTLLAPLFRDTPHTYNDTTIYFYSTFFTSIWLWVYSLACYSARTLYRLRKIFVKFTYWFDIDNKPIKCIGFIATIIATILYSLFGLVLSIV